MAEERDHRRVKGQAGICSLQKAPTFSAKHDERVSGRSRSELRATINPLLNMCGGDGL